MIVAVLALHWLTIRLVYLDRLDTQVLLFVSISKKVSISNFKQRLLFEIDNIPILMLGIFNFRFTAVTITMSTV